MADKNNKGKNAESDKDREFREGAATILGMRDDEVVEVDGTVVTLKDGTRFDVDLDGKSYQQVLGDRADDADDAERGTERPAETAGSTLSALEKSDADGTAPATDAMARPFEVPNVNVPGGTEDADRPTGDRTAPGTSRTGKRKP